MITLLDAVVSLLGLFLYNIETSSWYILIIIIINSSMSCRWHGYPSPSLDTSTYRSSPPAGPPSCCMYVRAGRPASARPYGGIHRSTSLMSSSLLLQQCPASLVRLTWIVFVMEGRWRIVGALWGAASRTCSILLAIFLCNCSLASSPGVVLASKLCIHTAVSTRPLPRRNCVSFYRSGLISIWSIAYR